MSDVSNLNKLRSYLEQLGYPTESINEIISSYTAIIPVLATIALRLYKEQKK